MIYLKFRFEATVTDWQLLQTYLNSAFRLQNCGDLRVLRALD